MTSPPHESEPRSLPLDALEAALEQSHDVKAKVEACANDLASANDVAKDRMAEGATTLPAARCCRPVWPSSWQCRSVQSTCTR
jgi:diguanylate cyclase